MQAVKSQLLNLSKKILIESQIFVSLCGTMFAVFFMLQYGCFHWYTAGLLFLTYLNGYLYTKFQHSKIRGKVFIINVLSTILCLVIIRFASEISFVKWLVIVMMGLLYNSFFLEKIVRKIPLLKVFYVGLTWALACSWLVLSKFSAPVFFASWLFITALVLPFDIRDMDGDDVVTFPKLIGIQRTKFLGYLLIFSASVIAFFYFPKQFSNAFLLTSVISFLLIFYAEKTNRESYFSVWVELCSALPLIFWLIISRLY